MPNMDEKFKLLARKFRDEYVICHEKKREEWKMDDREKEQYWEGSIQALVMAESMIMDVFPEYKDFHLPLPWTQTEEERDDE